MGMHRDYRNTAIVALAAVLLTLMVLMFVAYNPWMLLGVAAVLWAIAAIVRAINGITDPDHSARRRSRKRGRSSTNDSAQDDLDDEEADGDVVDQPDTSG